MRSMRTRARPLNLSYSHVAMRFVEIFVVMAVTVNPNSSARKRRRLVLPTRIDTWSMKSLE